MDEPWTVIIVQLCVRVCPKMFSGLFWTSLWFGWFIFVLDLCILAQHPFCQCVRESGAILGTWAATQLTRLVFWDVFLGIVPCRQVYHEW